MQPIVRSKSLSSIFALASLVATLGSFAAQCLALDFGTSTASYIEQGILPRTSVQADGYFRDLPPTPPPSCKPCVEVLVNNQCQSSGRSLCANGNCVDDPSQCGCNPACNPCTQECVGSSEGNSPIVWRCQNSGKKLCPDGRCVKSEDNCKPCNPPCKNCTERCSDGSCTSFPGKECPDGSCCATNQSCEDCEELDCAPCVEMCSADGECKPRNFILCSTGACLPRGSSCPSS